MRKHRKLFVLREETEWESINKGDYFFVEGFSDGLCVADEQGSDDPIRCDEFGHCSEGGVKAKAIFLSNTEKISKALQELFDKEEPSE